METVAIGRIRKGLVADAVRQVVADVGGMSRYVQPGARVLIKPNLVNSTRDWHTGSTVNPAVVEALAALAWEAGASEVLIGEGSGVGENTWNAFRTLGYEVMAQRCGARLVDLNEDTVLVNCPGVVLDQLAISKAALAADVVIDVPVLKTHSQTVVSLSLKNMKGVVSQRWKRKIHFVGLAQGIVDLNKTIGVQLVVVDATVAQEGSGPVAGEPVEMNLILAGANRVAVDAVACWLMSIDPSIVPHIRLASEAGLGPLERAEISIVGEPLDGVKRAFKTPPLSVEGVCSYDGVCMIAGVACSGCTGSLDLAMKDLHDSGELARIVDVLGHVNIVYGEDAEVQELSPEEFCLLVGKCARGAKDSGVWVPGCPPGLAVIMDGLREAAGLPTKGVPVNWEDVPDDNDS